MSGWNPLVIWPFLSMEVLCGFSEMIILVGIIGDRAGQLGESGEYWMGRLRVVWIINSELQGASPRLCQLRLASIGSKWISIKNVLAHMGHMKTPNVVASCVNELDDTLPHITGVQWDSVRATHGVSAEAYAWKTALWWGSTQSGFLVTSWIVATHGASRPAYVMLSGFYPCKVDYWFKSPWHTQTWVMVCSPNINIELSTS
jgi:hypothetical protein